MWFAADSVALGVAQAACIALPGSGAPGWAARLRTGAWALVLPVSIAAVVAAIVMLPVTADLLTWTALVLVPAGAVLGLGWAIRGSRWWLGGLAVPLLAVAWSVPRRTPGELAAVLLIGASAIAAARLIAAVAMLLVTLAWDRLFLCVCLLIGGTRP